MGQSQNCASPWGLSPCRTSSRALWCQGTAACWLPAAVAPHKSCCLLPRGIHRAGATPRAQGTASSADHLHGSVPWGWEQKPGFDHRDDKTLDKALCLPPEALPALCRHQELDHRAPKVMGECNYPCLADGEDGLAAQAAQEPDLLAPSSMCSPRQQSPSKPVALPSPSAPGSWELRAHNGPVLWVSGS